MGLGWRGSKGGHGHPQRNGELKGRRGRKQRLRWWRGGGKGGGRRWLSGGDRIASFSDEGKCGIESPQKFWTMWDLRVEEVKE